MADFCGPGDCSPANWYQHAKFRVLLAALVALILCQPLLADSGTGRVLYSTTWSFVQLAMMLAISEKKSQRLIGLAFGLPTLAGIWATHLFVGSAQRSAELATYAIAATFFGIVAVMLMRHLATHSVTADNVAGAACGYLLLAVGIGLVYIIVESVRPHSFQASGELADDLADPVRRRALLSYFSFVTITTVGYGDVTPATPVTRVLASLEAVLGQLYLAILVAGLIGIRVGRRIDSDSAPT